MQATITNFNDEICRFRGRMGDKSNYSFSGIEGMNKDLAALLLLSVKVCSNPDTTEEEKAAIDSIYYATMSEWTRRVTLMAGREL